MYKSKDSGRNVCRFFDAHMEATVQERAGWTRNCGTALRRGSSRSTTSRKWGAKAI